MHQLIVRGPKYEFVLLTYPFLGVGVSEYVDDYDHVDVFVNHAHARLD